MQKYFRMKWTGRKSQPTVNFDQLNFKGWVLRKGHTDVGNKLWAKFDFQVEK